jgi:hypothetical protein
VEVRRATRRATRPAIARLTVSVGPDEDELLALVHAQARAQDRPVRALHLEALLGLPRLADACGRVDTVLARAAIDSLAARLPDAGQWQVGPVGSVDELRFGPLDRASAGRITDRFHYLHSPRSQGTAFALFVGGTDAVGALSVVSPLDVGRLADLLLGRGREPRTAAVLSRVFAFPGMPRNSLSFLLARTAEAMRAQGVTDLVTYVNPNMGFTGVSYAASGWTRLGDEPGTTYRYLDGRYITDRELAARYGPSSDEDRRSQLGPRFAVSVMPLRPLDVFWRPLSR